MSANTFGIDLGTSNIKIYDLNADGVIVEKNMIAVKDKTHVFAYGNSAYDMYEKAPNNIKISYPLSNGVIADINHMETLVRLFVNAQMRGQARPIDVYVAIPHDVTEVERKAFRDLIRDSNVRARDIMLVEKAVADALGMDIDVLNSQGVLIVDIGFETTEISVLSLGGIVISKLMKTAGRKFDDSVRNIIRRELSLIIGEKTAENIRISLKDLEEHGEQAVVYGRDIVTGLPVERKIPTNLIDMCMIDDFDQILDTVKATLERTPPELAADIYKKGIYLTGGASQTMHLAQHLSNGLSLNVNLSDIPVVSVSMGLAKIIRESAYRSLAYDIDGGGK
ncbi:MAG: rod shape-determining protein [Lachnospiraceae bacterium]|nr:rod shape-determining protein [Lachnospiraceae bacterium]